MSKIRKKSQKVGLNDEKNVFFCKIQKFFLVIFFRHPPQKKFAFFAKNITFLKK